MAVSTIVRWHHPIENWVFELYYRHFRAMDFVRASNTGANWLLRIGPRLSTHTTVLRNLRLAYPNESEAWRLDLARAQWAQLGRVVGEYPHPERFQFDASDERGELVGGEILDRVRESGKGAVFISGHFSNFELMPVAIVRRGVTCAMTYRPLNNPLMDKRLREMRIAYGATLQAAKGREGGMGLLRALKRGHAIALMNDQKYDEGVPAPLFGHDAMTADAPTRLAMQFDVPLIALSTRRLEGQRFRVTVHPPIAIDAALPKEDAVRDTVRRINQFVEAEVRAAPDQWFWVHKRWPRAAWEAAGVL